MVKVQFTIPVDPVAQGRPRITTIGGRPRAYEPAKSRSYKAYVADFTQRAMIDAGLEKPIEGPLCIRARFAFPLPKSQWRKRTPRPEEWRDKKPDLDNLVKNLLDGLQPICFLDDRQVAKMVVEKVTLAQGEAPYTSVVVEQLLPRN